MKTSTLKMPKLLLLSGLQVALAEAVLWRWQAEQRHGPRRIAKHPELSGLLPLPACEVQSSELRLLCLDDLRGRDALIVKDLAAAGGWESRDGSREQSPDGAQMEPRWNQRSPRWNSDGSKGIQD